MVNSGTYIFQRNVQNVVQVRWDLCCNDVVAPIVANVGQEKTNEREACENFLEWRKRSLLVAFVAVSVLQNVQSLLLQKKKNIAFL